MMTAAAHFKRGEDALALSRCVNAHLFHLNTGWALITLICLWALISRVCWQGHEKQDRIDTAACTRADSCRYDLLTLDEVTLVHLSILCSNMLVGDDSRGAGSAHRAEHSTCRGLDAQEALKPRKFLDHRW